MAAGAAARRARRWARIEADALAAPTAEADRVGERDRPLGAAAGPRVSRARAVRHRQRLRRSPAFSERDEHVPEVDAAYRFNPDVTLAILAGFMRNRRVLVQGLHGSGKSTHIEQVAARLNWPCVRVNLDGHISRLDLVGKDAVVLRDGQQVTEFQEGIVPWALQRPVALVFDEYDAGRPDVMFVIQRVLERDGKFTLMDQNRVLTPHPCFRLFATANTVGLGNLNGLYHGAQRLNHAQIDRWNIVATLNYLPRDEEVAIVAARVPALAARRRALLQPDGGAGRADAQGLCRRRPVDADVAAHGDQLGREPRDLPRRGAWRSGSRS